MERFRIINKNKNGVIFAHDKSQRMSWEAFNNDFIIVDGIYAEFKPEREAVYDKLHEKVIEVTVMYLELMNCTDPARKLTLSSVFGSTVQEIAKELNCSITDVAQLVKKNIQALKI